MISVDAPASPQPSGNSQNSSSIGRFTGEPIGEGPTPPTVDWPVAISVKPSLSHTLQTSQNFLLQKMLQKTLKICVIMPAFLSPEMKGKYEILLGVDSGGRLESEGSEEGRS